MKASNIMQYLETYFPLSLQEPWDKCGLQIGDVNQEITKVMIAINIDLKTIKKALDNNCQMLISHHPFLLEKIEVIDLNTNQGKCIELAMQHQLLIYSLHTCLDQGKDGISMNDWLIQLFDVKEVTCYDNTKIGKKAILNKPMPIHQFIEKTKQIFDIPYIKYACADDKVISSIAICGGSGAGDMETVYQQVDAFITGDTKYHHAQYALEHDIALIDVPHHIEVVMEQEVKKLLSKFNIETVVASSKDYYTYM